MEKGVTKGLPHNSSKSIYQEVSDNFYKKLNIL